MHRDTSLTRCDLGSHRYADSSGELTSAAAAGAAAAAAAAAGFFLVAISSTKRFENGMKVLGPDKNELVQRFFRSARPACCHLAYIRSLIYRTAPRPVYP